MTEIARLRWRCRRGMRELDQLLGWYLETRYPHDDAPTQRAFEALLDAQDPDLWNWFCGRGAPAQAEWRGIVDAIRNRDRV